MAFTTTDLDNIEAAIATGELTVSVNGRTVTYRSMTDLLKARDLISGALQSNGTIAKVTRTSYAQRGRS